MRKHTNRANVAMVAIAALTFAAPASAHLVTIDPDEYAAGTNLQFAGSYARLSTYTNAFGTPPHLDPVFAISSEIPEAAPNMFGRLSGRFSMDFRNTFEARECIADPNCVPEHTFGVFRSDFAFGTSYVEVESVMLDFAIDGAFLYAYGFDGSPLESCWVPGAGYRAPLSSFDCWERTQVFGCDPNDPNDINCSHTYRAHIERDTDDIAFIIWGGHDRGWTPAYLDRFTYRVSVPEPSTVALMGLGLLGAFATRRRQLRSAKVI